MKNSTFVWHQVCQTLWCKLPDNRCVSRLEPAAPGTSCAKHKVRKQHIFISCFYGFTAICCAVDPVLYFAPFGRPSVDEGNKLVILLRDLLSVYHQMRHGGETCSVSLSGAVKDQQSARQRRKTKMRRVLGGSKLKAQKSGFICRLNYHNAARV